MDVTKRSDEESVPKCDSKPQKVDGYLDSSLPSKQRTRAFGLDKEYILNKIMKL